MYSNADQQKTTLYNTVTRLTFICVARNLRMSCDVGATRNVVIRLIICQNQSVMVKLYMEGTMSGI